MSTQETSTSAPPRGAVHVMTKPIGPICNLDCAYCYYLEKEDLYPGTKSFRMQDDTLRAYVKQYIESQPANEREITFAWQGGEPTLLGIDFFQRAVAYQKEFTPPGKRCVNSLQTNGTLLDDAWCAFFKHNQFLIGISIDGPQDLHDYYRYDKKGEPSFDEVMRGWKLLRKHGVDHNILTVVNNINAPHPRRVYNFLKKHGAQYVQFIPIVERESMTTDEVSERTVDSKEFGTFLAGVFDEWVKADVGKIFVQIFDQALSAWMNVEPSLCVFRKRCGKALAMEHNGDLYSCDHFVTPEYKLGNIMDLPIIDLATNEQQIAFGDAKETSLPQYCLDCDVRFICNGECPKNRFIQTPDGEAGLNYLCAGYKQFFSHIRPVMDLMVVELQNQRSPANVMQILKNQNQEKSQPVTQSKPLTSGKVGRNDPCPCGSGRKYKSCCMKNH